MDDRDHFVRNRSMRFQREVLREREKLKAREPNGAEEMGGNGEERMEGGKVKEKKGRQQHGNRGNGKATTAGERREGRKKERKGRVEVLTFVRIEQPNIRLIRSDPLIVHRYTTADSLCPPGRGPSVAVLPSVKSIKSSCMQRSSARLSPLILGSHFVKQPILPS